MPDDNAALANLQVEFPALRNESADSRPASVPALLDYLTDEVPNGGKLT